MGRTRTFLGLALILIGTILLSRALMQPVIPPLPPLPPMPDMPALPALPAMPALPPAPPLPPLPPIPLMHPAPLFHAGAWLSPPVLIIGLLLAVFWLRRRATRERPLA